MHIHFNFIRFFSKGGIWTTTICYSCSTFPLRAEYHIMDNRAQGTGLESCALFLMHGVSAWTLISCLVAICGNVLVRQLPVPKLVYDTVYTPKLQLSILTVLSNGNSIIDVKPTFNPANVRFQIIPQMCVSNPVPCALLSYLQTLYKI